LPLYPFTDLWGKGAGWGLLGAFSLMVGLMPWLPPLRRAGAAAVDLTHCNGCGRCAEDCPYEAIRMVRRSDGRAFPAQAQVNPSLCAACGICMGACPYSVPFRRTGELKTGVDLPDYPFCRRELRKDGRGCQVSGVKERTQPAVGCQGDGRGRRYACTARSSGNSADIMGD